MVNKRRRQVLKAAGVAGFSGLAGCAGGGDGEGTPTTAGTDGDDDGDDGGGGEQGTTNITFISGHQTSTLDPHRVGSDTTFMTAVNFYDPLLYPAAETYAPSSYLAEDLAVADDDLTWTVTLRDDVTFHNGDQLTAQDVKYSIERYLALGEGVSSVWSGVLTKDGVSVLDDQQIEFKTEQPFSAFPTTLTQLFVVNSKVVKEHEADGDFGERGDYGRDWLNDHVAGSGGYKLIEWSKGDVMKLEAFEDYWQGWDDNRFDTASVDVVPEGSTAKLMMQRGDADLTHQFMSAQTYKEMDKFDNVDVKEVPQLQSWNGTFNTRKAPTDDLQVRKAFAHSFDYENMLTNVFFDAAPAIGPVPRIMEAHNGDLEPYTQDPEMAQQALEASSYTVDEINEMGVELMYFSGFQTYRKFCLLLKQNLKDVLGITNVTIEPKQVAQLFDALMNVETMAHVTPVANTADIPTAYNYTYLMYHPSAFPENSGGAGYGNGARWTTDELTGILEDIQTEFDRDSRLQLYKEAQRHIVEGYPHIFTANPKYRIGMNNNVGGWQFHGTQSFDLRWWEMHRKGDGRAK